MAEMNVVPLIDILLVLLIIFMVISPTMTQGLRAEVPAPGHGDGDVMKTIVVQVAANGALRINNEVSSWEHLGARLREIFRSRADKVAFVKGDVAVDFSQVARAIDVIQAAGIEQVGLLTDRMQAEPGQTK